MVELASAELIRRSFDWYSDGTAVVDIPNERRLTFDELGDRTFRVADALWDLSPKKGTRVATLMENRSEFVEVDFATSLVGKIRVGLNTRLTTDEYQYILNDCGVNTLVYSDRFRDAVASLRDSIPAENFVSIGCSDEFSTEYETLIDGRPTSPPPVDVSGDAYDYIMYTSGTTGRPKGAVHTQRGRIAATRNMLADELEITADNSMLHIAPLTHGSGSKLITFFLKGATNVILDGFDPRRTLETVEGEEITNTFVVPTIIKRLLEVENRSAYDTASLEQISYGGEPIPSSVLDEAIEYFGSIFVQVYGAAEVPHPISVLGKADHDPDDEEKLTSAGRPTTNVRVRLLDDDGTEVDRGEVGEIVVKGANVTATYWENFDATNDAIERGWFHTGDLGTLNEDGYLSIVGRKKDMIISGGMNVYPAQVEDTLQQHPAVREVAVVGVDDEQWGERVVAYVDAVEDVAEEDLTAFAKERIASYKVPKEVRFLDALPKGSTGKIEKKELERRERDGTSDDTG